MNQHNSHRNLPQKKNKVILLLLLLIFLSGCAQTSLTIQPAVTATYTPALTSTATTIPSQTPTPALTATFTSTPSATLTAFTPTASSSGCASNPITAKLLPEASASGWLEWVKMLSGAQPVTVGGEEVRFTTRYTPSMFSKPGPNALDFVHETIAGWYPEEQIAVQSFTATFKEQTLHGKNLILTIPGTTKKEEVVILSAHLDSISGVTPDVTAPGAEDNASGSAGLLEAAWLLRGHAFQRTIRIIWFTGEEQGILGSKAYVKELENPGAIQAVINLDMFGYDADNDRCFEIHAGALPASDQVGQCFLQSIDQYDLGLPQPDYLTKSATGASDHGSFWAAKVGAIEILENLFDQRLPGGCVKPDKNASYHTPKDTYDRLNADSAIRIVRAALATLLAYAGPIQ